jgi:hypothetical protein
MYQQLLKNYAAEGANVIDNWWSSESGLVTSLSESYHLFHYFLGADTRFSSLQALCIMSHLIAYS